MIRPDETLIQQIQKADQALLEQATAAKVDAGQILALHARRRQRRCVRGMTILVVGLSTLVWFKHAEKEASRSEFNNPPAIEIAAVQEIKPEKTDNKPELPAFEPPIELELERESIAVIYLNRALRLRKAGNQPDEANAALDFIVNTLPTTVSADHARTLLASPNMTSLFSGEDQ